MEEIHFYFKLFNSIKEEHEVDFAELELLGLFGEVKRIKNFMDEVVKEPLIHFINDDVRIQDILTHELPYGRFQGFHGVKDRLIDVSPLVKRLAYTREFFMIIEGREPEDIVDIVFKDGIVGRNLQYFKSGELILLRFITNQYYLEKSQYISKVSRNEEEINRNVDVLSRYLIDKLYRIPATERLSVGKRLEDYFAIREEPSLYLTHYMHPYKGKFHPKMVRALLNYACPKREGVVMDNFAGSGTLLVEATLMGLNSIGIEINPLSALMANVKCQSLTLDPERLKLGISRFIKEVEERIEAFKKDMNGSSLDEESNSIRSTLKSRYGIPKNIIKMFKRADAIWKIIIAHEEIGRVKDDKIRDFLLLGLSGTISDLTRRRKSDFTDVLKNRLHNLYLRVYLFHKLNEDLLRINLGRSETYIGDARNMRDNYVEWNGKRIKVGDDSIDAIINSPPYSTALDYIRNDLPQLILLNLSPIEAIEERMIGNPKLKHYPPEVIDEVKRGEGLFIKLPTAAKTSINRLIHAGKVREAVRTYKFFRDMYSAMKEEYRILKEGSKCIMIIGNNHYKVENGYVEIENDEVILHLAREIGFKVDRIITRELEKTKTGMIRYESVIILEK